MKRTEKTIGNIGTLLSTVSPKTVLAAVLLLVMALLWLRVFLRGQGGPNTAEALTVLTAEPVAVGRSSPERTAAKMFLQPHPLPVEPGRHDRLLQDPFVLDRAKWFPQEQPSAVSVQAEEPVPAAAQQEALLRKIAEKLLLQAVIKDPSGLPVQVCVNGVVLPRGGILKLKENGETYELKVLDMGPQQVRFECQNRVITVQMPSSEWLD